MLITVLKFIASCPCSEPDQSSPCSPSHFLNVHFNNLPCKPGSSKWSFSLMLHASPIPFSRFVHPNYIWSGAQVIKLLICSFVHSPATSSLLGPNILLSTIFSNTLSLRYILYASDHISHPYKTTGKILILYILIFILFDSKLEDKRFCTEWQQTFLDFHLLLNFFPNWILFVKIVPK